MQADEILNKMATSSTFYGLGAKRYVNDDVLGTKFLLECYNQILCDENGMISCVGRDIVSEIKAYYESIIS